MRAVAGFALLAAALCAGVFTVYHAPNYTLLPLSVGAPEVSHFILVAAIAGAWLAVAASRGRVRWLAAALALPAIALPGSVLRHVPGTITRFDHQFRAAGLGQGDGDTPLSLVTLFTSWRGRDGVIVERGLPFSSAGGEALALDIHRPRRDGVFPIVIQTFAGAWRGGAREDNASFAAALASRGFVVVSIDYRLAPRWRWPAQLEDARAGLRWVKANGAAHGGDPTRLVMLGRSSGAQVAFITAMTAADPAIRAIVLFYSPVNLTEGYRIPPVPDTLGLRKIETDFIGGTPDDLPEAYRAASPITYADQPHPPVLLIHGARDRIVYPQYEAALHETLSSSGTSVLLEIPWADHAFDAVTFGPSAQLALHYTNRFLSAVVK